MNGASANRFERPLVAWLGDDFTGAAAVMEVLSFAGLPSILYLSPPGPEALAESKGLMGIGVATLARSQSPRWMEGNLPPIYEFLDQTGAEFAHYKICSTLDSSPQVGSIGKAIDLGRQHFGAHAVPVITAAPEMRRYQAFGSLFCSAADGVHRLDRHPVMAHHPVTPMAEADVARHLAEQTETPTGCIDLEDFRDGRANKKIASAPDIWTLDMISAEQQVEVGKLLWDRRRDSRFVVGSQGVEYALVSYLRSQGLIEFPRPLPSLGRDDSFAVVSGSASPTSASQIAWARQNGFAPIRLDVARLLGPDPSIVEDQALSAAKEANAAGTPPIVFTAEGPDDPALRQVRDLMGGDMDRANDLIGRSLGRIMRALVTDLGLSRIAVSGGDTSGRVCEALGIYALEAAAPTIPGAAICRARTEGALDGMEIALKGGQMGSPDYFGWVRDGGGTRA
ncbi:four-carbon acid sugar kinase family protein [Roseobacter sp.]|uniref:four-carbon acid sugar kinase family protein n=1 Tax=Roseobacter sp. TaxID=1907202 RepID=UPI00385C99DC